MLDRTTNVLHPPTPAPLDPGRHHRFCHVAPGRTLPRKQETDDKKRSSVLHQDEQYDRSLSGPMWLQNPRIASVVANALLYGDTVRGFYTLHAWVIMPNHVHAILEPHTKLPAIMRWLKGRTGRVANRILGLTGTFWQNESFDHRVRSGEELDYLTEYVESNPVKAGLADTNGQWQWSSVALSGSPLPFRQCIESRPAAPGS